VADLNGDGIQDIAAIDYSWTLYVYLGNGDGTFAAPVTYPMDGGPDNVLIGDLNHDGRPDIVVTEDTGVDSAVTAYLGIGDGAFQKGAPNIVTDADIRGTALGDINQDGNLDLVAIGFPRDFDGITIFLGNGDGTFKPGSRDTQDGGQSMALADVNRDGLLDLIVGGLQGVEVLAGNGDGTFQSAVSYPLGFNVGNLGIADFNGDGFLDVSAMNEDGSGGVCYLGTGGARFARPVEYPFDSPRAALVADFNNDGIPDLAVSYYSGIQILLGVGDGSFVPGGSYTAEQPQNYGTLAVDWNGDGNLDIITVDYISGDLDFLFGNGDGTLQPPVVYPISFRIGALLAADYDGDGVLDLGYSSSTAEAEIILRGDGKGGVKNTTYFTIGKNPSGVANGHFLSKSKTDVAIGTDGGVALLLNLTP